MKPTMQEIERKFLLKNMTFKEEAVKSSRILQVFLNSQPERTVRVRIMGETAFLTIKGIPNKTGTTRFEWEKEISLAEAESLIALCEPGIIDKIRYEVPAGKHIWEIDEFMGENEGLIVAEVELESENESFEKPEWLGQEVTGEVKYYNSYLSKKPFKDWESS